MDGNQDASTIENEKNLTELMQLFQELVKTPAIRTKVLEVLTVSKMQSLLRPIMDSSNDSGFLDKRRNLFYVSSY